MEENLITVYIKIDDKKNITDINSSIFITNLNGWVEIGNGVGDRYAHAQGHYLKNPITTVEGVYRYKYINGEVVEKTETEISNEINLLPLPKPTVEEQLADIKNVMETMLGSEKNKTALQYNRLMTKQVQMLDLSDSEAMEYSDLYPEWEENTKYTINSIIKFGVDSNGNTQLYRVIQEHISQNDWKPDITPTLYKAIGFTDDNIDIWTQPLGAHDAYNKNDVVFHNNKKWVSAIDNNVWEPGVYGWNVVEESD